MSQPIKRKLRNPIHNPVTASMEPITDDTIVENIVCNKCGNTLPPHTIKVHLDATNKIHECPHIHEKEPKLPINNFDFDVTTDFNTSGLTEDEKALLSQPSGLTRALLISNYKANKYRELDFTGTTCEQAIKKILTFYKHKTYRRLLGNNIICEGFWEWNKTLGLYVIAMST